MESVRGWNAAVRIGRWLAGGIAPEDSESAGGGQACVHERILWWEVVRDVCRFLHEPGELAEDGVVWRLLLREYAEELLGTGEDYDTTGAPFDYAGWPFGAQMTAALDAGRARPYVLGVGVDPLTFATDLLA